MADAWLRLRVLRAQLRVKPAGGSQPEHRVKVRVITEFAPTLCGLRHSRKFVQPVSHFLQMFSLM